MANNKFVTIFTVTFSLLVLLIATQVCGVLGSNRDSPAFATVLLLYDFNGIDADLGQCRVGQENSLNISQTNLTSSFVNATASLSTPASGTSGVFGTSVFFDVIKLIFGLFGLLLGLPLYVMFYAIGLPTMVATILSVFIGVFTIIGWMELLRGGDA